MFLKVNKVYYLKKIFVVLLAFNSSQVFSALENDASIRFIAKVIASHFTMKNIGTISYDKDKLTLDLGLRVNFSGKKEISDNLPKSITEIDGLVSFLDSLTMIRSNFIEGYFGNYKGLSLHFQIMPMLKYETYTFSHFGFGIQWSYLDVIFDEIPFSAAIKGYTTKTSIIEKSNLIAYGSDMIGVIHLIGKEWKLFSLYMGYGFAKTDTEIDINAGSKINSQPKIAGFHSSLSFIFNYSFMRVGAEFSWIDEIKIASIKTSVFL